MIGALSRELRRLRGASGAAAPDRTQAGTDRATGPPAGSAAGVFEPDAGRVAPGGPRATEPASEAALAGSGSGGGPGGQPGDGAGSQPQALRPGPDRDLPVEPAAIRGSGERRRHQPCETAATARRGWRLRALPVCASTEIELDRWLQRLVPAAQDPLGGPVAVLARRQRFGRGQQGRLWSSPAGGVWLSAALPWSADPAAAAAPGLAVAVGLALQLEALGLEVRLKWPNDLLIAGPGGRAAKLAGLLPRLRLHGERIRWARVGIGLNGTNRVPAGATNLRGALGAAELRPERLTARVLLALEWAMASADQPAWVRRQAEARLLVAPRSWPGADQGWQPHGLADDGALVLARGEERQLLRRRFD